MKIIQEKGDQISFEVEMDESLANALRRLINNIPTLAIKDVEISKNGSPLYDETIAHRLGLTPLKNPKNKKTPELKISTKKKGFVYSGEIEGDVKIVFENIPITYLDEDQELQLNATTRFGIGEEHSKFSPGFMFYKNIKEIKLDKDYPTELLKGLPVEASKKSENKIFLDDGVSSDLGEIYENLNRLSGREVAKMNNKTRGGFGSTGKK